MNLESPLVRCRWVIAIWFVCFIIAAAVSLTATLFVGSAGKFWTETAMFYIGYVGIAVGLALACRNKGIEVRQLIGPMPPLTALLGYSLTVVPVILSSLGGYWLITQFAPHFFDHLMNNVMGIRPAGPAQIFLSFGMIVVIAPVVEEFTFRGLLFTRLSVKYSPRTAIVLTSIMFALLHLDFIGAFVFGLVAASMYARSRSLITPIALHCINNLVAWLGFIFDPSADSTLPVWLGWPALIVGFSMCIYLVARWTRLTIVPPYISGSLVSAPIKI